MGSRRQSGRHRDAASNALTGPIAEGDDADRTLGNHRLTQSTTSDNERVELTQKYPTSGLAVLHLTCRWSDLAADDADLVSYVVPRG